MSSIINERLQELRSMDESDLFRDLRRKDWGPTQGKLLLWQVKSKTACLLAHLVTKYRPRVILELGTSAGYSCLVFAKANPDCFIHTIECVPHRIKLAKESFLQTKIDNRVKLYEKKIVDVLSNWNDIVDFVFIDADKDNYSVYVNMILPFLSGKGLIVVDNVLDNPLKTIGFIKFMRSLPNFKTRVYKLDGGVLVSRKI